MDILWALLTLPYAPVRGLTAVVRVVAREAESQQYDPVNVRRELEELDRAAAAGDITPEERDRGQQRVLDRLTPPAADTGRTPSRANGGGRPAPARRRPVRRPGEQQRAAREKT
ncbi:gas vesicle protein GvpG [Micromonospora tulbaghiae]|uniref:gas vesicle protein GvpG n=1 Tax=Micromonospora tulbaghiae TaxID=479978 RepID=UPI0033B82480